MAELHVYYIFKLSILIEKNKFGNLATLNDIAKLNGTGGKLAGTIG